jgi:2-polyprenyl-3-methyl-5-hydroxy-6-metoxy-1,4-benzoquinol methylase
MVENEINPWFDSRSECPGCGSHQFTTIYQSPYDKDPLRNYLYNFYVPKGIVEFEYLKNASYILCECEKCSMVFQRDIPNDSLMERLYGHWIEPKSAFCRHQEQGIGIYLYYAQEIMRIISYFNRPSSSLSFFDFGMGWGSWALMAKAFGCDSYGSEVSAERIENARSNGIKIVTLEELPQQQFDFINTEQVLEHVPEPLKTLRHLKSSLKKDGIIKVSVPTANNIKARLKKMDWEAPRGTKYSLNPVAPLEHINFYTRKALVTMAAEAGMKEAKVPMSLHYKYLSLWGGTKWFAKSVLYPIPRFLLKTQNYVFFTNL